MAGSEAQTQRSYEDFIYIPCMMLKSIGYDVMNTPKPYWQNLLMRAYFLLGLGSHYYIIFYLILRIIQWDTLSGDPVIIVRYAELFFLTINSEIKIFTFVYYHNRIRELSNKLCKIYPKEESERRYYNVNEYYWPRIIRFGVYYFYLVVLLVVFGPFLQSTCIYFYQRHSVGNKAKFPYLRAYPMQLSFDTNSPINYMFVQILEFICSQFFMTFNIATDVWMMCLSGQICMHFAHLGRQLANYSPSRERSLEDCEFLIGIVQRHLHILSLHKELNDIFGMLLAYNLFTTASTLCCVAFYTIVLGLNLDGVSFLLYFVSCASQFYMVCHYGQLLIDLSEKLPQDAYNQNWYDGSPAYRKQLLYIMLNTKKPVMLTAKGVIIISLDTFKNMMNITYRFFAIIRRVLGD